MRFTSAVVFLGLLTACVGYRVDQRVVGHFEGPAGEAVVIEPDGRIVYVSAGREEFVGLITIDQEVPLSIRVIAPETSPLIGTTITFSEQRRQITVQWPAWQGTAGTSSRSTTFNAK